METEQGLWNTHTHTHTNRYKQTRLRLQAKHTPQHTVTQLWNSWHNRKCLSYRAAAVAGRSFLSEDSRWEQTGTASEESPVPASAPAACAALVVWEHCSPEHWTAAGPGDSSPPRGAPPAPREDHTCSLTTESVNVCMSWMFLPQLKRLVIIKVIIHIIKSNLHY